MAKLLIVEDDRETSLVLQDWLKHQSYQIEVAFDGQEALDFLSSYGFDLVLLDWELPSVSGIDVLRTFRQTGASTPVLFLTALDSTESKETGLDYGADDYLTKPVDLRELSARVRALLRRASGSPARSEIRVGNLLLDQSKRTVYLDEEPLTLTRTEFGAVEYFMKHPNHIVSVDMLIDKIWKSDAPGTDASVRILMTRLRRKIDKKGQPSRIESVYGLGYRFNAP